jgi:hypothetical protein
MVGATNAHSSSNSNKQKFVKVLKKLGVAHIVPNTFQTPTSWFINYLTPKSSSFTLKSYHVLAPLLMPQTIFDVAYTSFQTSSHHYSMKNYQIQGCHKRLHNKIKP